MTCMEQIELRGDRRFSRLKWALRFPTDSITKLMRDPGGFTLLTTTPIIECMLSLLKTRRTLCRSFSTSLDSTHIGTVVYHKALLLLHIDRPPSTWPSKVQSIIPFYSLLQLRSREWMGLVNVCYPSTLSQTPHSTSSFIEPPVENLDVDSETKAYPATFFARNTKPLDIPSLSISNLDEYIEIFKKNTEMTTVSPSIPEGDQRSFVYVCTHGARDCRCGTTGSEVYEGVKLYIEERGLSNRVQAAEVSHVGGHK